MHFREIRNGAPTMNNFQRNANMNKSKDECVQTEKSKEKNIMHNQKILLLSKWQRKSPPQKAGRPSQLSTLRHLQTRLLTTWQCDMITWDLPMASIRRVYQHVIFFYRIYNIYIYIYNIYIYNIYIYNIYIYTIYIYTIYIYIMMYMMYLYTLRPPGFPSLLTTMLGWVVWGVGVGVGGWGFRGAVIIFQDAASWAICYDVVTFDVDATSLLRLQGGVATLMFHGCNVDATSANSPPSTACVQKSMFQRNHAN